TDGEWSAMCGLMGLDITDRRADDVDALVSAWTRERDRFDVADLLQDSGIAAAAVESIADALTRDPQLASHYQRVRQPSAPDVDIVIDGEAIRFSGTDRPLPPAHRLGQDNEYVRGLIRDG